MSFKVTESPTGGNAVHSVDVVRVLKPEFNAQYDRNVTANGNGVPTGTSPSLESGGGEGYNGNQPERFVDDWNGTEPEGGPGAEGAGDILKFQSWDDFKGYIQDVGKNGSLTNAEKVQKIQKAYDGIADKTDINIPISDKHIKGFTADGNVDYNWPKYLGFDKATISSISRSNLLPETWDRYGSMKGSNFADLPSSGRYSYGERSIPYVENEKAYHSGKFNNATYFDKIDAIRSDDLNTLNKILRSEGIPELDASEFMNLRENYDDFIAKIAKEVGTHVDATYGIKGRVAAWGDLKGGAGQINAPFNGKTLMGLGIII